MDIIDYANSGNALTISVAESDCGRLIYILDQPGTASQSSTGSFGWIGDHIPSDAESLKEKLRSEVDDFNRAIVSKTASLRAVHELAFA
jgi:hypothetical protein